MSVLFELYELCGIQLRNRFVRSATIENMALENGHPLPQLFEAYRELADGGVGMVNTSAIFPDAGWNPGHPLKPMILASDEDIPLFGKLTDVVHRAGARITAQLAPPFCFNREHIAPSPYSPGTPAKAMPREVTRAEMEQILATYQEAARRSREAGFDAVQIHAAHGYTLAKFISPLFNRRTDAYGGSIGSTHNSRGPLDKQKWTKNFYMPFAEEIKRRVKAPVMMVGGLRRFEVVESVIREGRADLISLSRPFLREPDLVNRWMQGDRSPAACTSCDGCSGLLMKGQPVVCVFR